MEMVKNRAAAVGTLFTTLVLAGFVMAGAASAQTTDPVTGAFSDAQTKVTTYGTALVALVLVGLGIALGIKYLSKGFRKA